jgi:site-specific recombinase XerD
MTTGESLILFPRVPAAALAKELAKLDVAGARFDQAARSKNTHRAYASDWKGFLSWCAAAGAVPLPTSNDTIKRWLTWAAGKYKWATISRKLTAISKAHALASCARTPVDQGELADRCAGIRNTLGTRGTKKTAIAVDVLRKVVGALPSSPSGYRDRALLVVGFAGGLRRSPLVALDVEDLTQDTDGLCVLIRKDKTDQARAGRTIGLPYGSDPKTCPVRSVALWLDWAGITTGAVFRQVDRHGRVGDRMSDRAAAEAVKRAVERAGLDPKAFGGHSLRRGFVTSAHRAGKSVHAIKRQTGHKDLRTLDEYIDDAGVLGEENAARGIGL